MFDKYMKIVNQNYTFAYLQKHCEVSNLWCKTMCRDIVLYKCRYNYKHKVVIIYICAYDIT